MPNIQLLDQIIKQISEYPDEWDQTYWSQQSQNDCSTSYCIAGWAVALSHPDANFLYEYPGIDPKSRVANNVEITVQLGAGRQTREVREIHLLARELLDLDRVELKDLFFAPTNLDQVKALRDAWATKEKGRDAA